MLRRPLRSFSDFVVETLPRLLEISEETAARGSLEELRALAPGTIEEAFASPERSLAAYDLKVTEWALHHSGMPVPQDLTDLVDRFAIGGRVGLTYEDLILTNPVEDMRLFTRGAYGETERLFYRNHREIEDVLALLIDELQQAIMSESSSGIDVTVLAERFDVITEKTRELAHMADGHFPAFRKYFNPHSGRQWKGPSGAFSARVPILELLFRGNRLPYERFEYIAENWLYFPSCDEETLALAIEARNAGRTYCWRLCGTPGFDAIEAMYTTFFNAWRRNHLQAVARQLPEVLRGESAGTSGETDVKRFLTTRITKEEEEE